MVEIYAAPASREYEMFYFDRIFPYLNSERKKYINSFLHVEDTLRSLAGEWLTRFVLTGKLHLNLFEIKIDYGKNGKPYFNSASGLHFNISHSEDWSVCAVSALPVGIDIEMKKNIDINFAKDYFTEIEFETMKSFTDKSEQLDYFYTIWTVKESYLKTLGSGFSIAPDSFEADIKNSQILLTGDVERGYAFKLFDFDTCYRLCVCSLETQFIDNIKICKPK